MVGKIQKRNRPTEKTQTFNVSSGAYEYLCCIMQMHIIATARRSYFYIFPLMTPRLEMVDRPNFCSNGCATGDTYEVDSDQRRQSGSKSGGRESGRRNFRF